MLIPTKNIDGFNSSQKDIKAAEIKKSQDMFFKLLMAQLKSQDVENTVDMNQMTQQIFHMNQLQTLMSIDNKLDDLNENLHGSSAFNLGSNIIGKYAMTENDQIVVSNNEMEIPVSYIIDGNRQPVNIVMKVVDSQGKMIFENKIEDSSSNVMQNFDLKFKNPDGSLSVSEGIYKVHILACDKNTKAPLISHVYTPHKIEQTTSGGQFILSDGTEIKLENILALQASPMALSSQYNPLVKSKHDTQSINELLKLKA